MAASVLNVQNIEKLSNGNYETWKVQMKFLLRYNDLWGFVTKEIVKTEENNAAWNAKDGKALDLIMLSVQTDQYTHLENVSTSFDAWETLNKIHASKGPMKNCLLFKQLYRMKKGRDKSMTDYVNEFTRSVQKLNEAGIKLPDEVVPIILLNSLPKEYEPFCVAIESREVLPTLDELKVKLMEEEIRRGNDEDAECKEAGLTATDTSKGVTTKSNFQNKTRMTTTQERPREFRGNCYVCNRYGHSAKNCHSRSNRTYNTNRTSNDFNKRQNTSHWRNNAMAAALNNYHIDPTTWILDRGATIHITNNKNKFKDLKNISTKIYTGTQESVEVIGKGGVKITVRRNMKTPKEIFLQEVMYAPKFKNNLLSIPQIIKHGFKVIFENGYAKVMRKNGEIMLIGKERNGLYLVEEEITHHAHSIDEKPHDTPLIKWHERLGHLNFKDVRKLKLNEVVIGINEQLETLNPVCEVCIKSKIHQLPHQTTNYRAKKKLELVHSDLCGPFKVSSLGGAYYFVTFIDDKSRYIYLKVIKNKSDVLETFKEYKAYEERQTGCKLKRFRTDNGKEYLSNEFKQFLKNEEIVNELTVPYTPQQNGVAERANRTLVEMARCLMLQANLPDALWAEAINTSVYLRNRCPTKLNQNETPYEEWTGQKPYIGYLRKIGSRVIALKKGPKRGHKFEPRGKEYVLVGYSMERKAYRLWERGTKTVINERDVKLIEEQNNVAREQEEQEEQEKQEEQPQLCQIGLDQEPEEDSTEEEPEEQQSTTREETIEETPIRTRGRPRIERTGKRGRPRKIYHSKPHSNTEEMQNPTHIQEALDRSDGEQ